MPDLLAPPALVAPPDRVPLPYGLFSVLSPESSGERWEAGGVQWEALTYEPAQGLPISCDLSDLLDDNGSLHNAEGSGNQIARARPFTVHGYFECSVIGFSVEEAQARAEAHLLAREQQRAEQALWTGDLQNYPNLAGEGYAEQDEPFPFEPPTHIGSFAPLQAIAELEDFIATMYGSLGVIHIPRKLAVKFLAEGLIERRSQGGTLYTQLGTPVVAGSGYTGDTIRATPALFGFRSEVDAYTDNQSTFNPNRNDMLAVASRTYLIGFESAGQAIVTVAEAGGAEFPTSFEVSNFPDVQPVTVQNTPLPVVTEGEPSA